MAYQGPVRPGTDVKKFRRTGRSEQGPFQGPVRLGTDVETFRRTGKSGSGSSRKTAGKLLDEQRAAKAAQEAAKKAQQEAQRKAQEKAKKIEQERIKQRREAREELRKQLKESQTEAQRRGATDIYRQRLSRAEVSAYEQRRELPQTKRVEQYQESRFGGLSQAIVEPAVETPQPSPSAVEGQAPLSIDVAPPVSERQFYSGGFGTATKAVFGRIGQNIKTFFTGRAEDGYADVLEPLEYAGKPKIEKVVKGTEVTYIEPKFGTIAPGEKPFKEVTIKEEPKTFREIQREREQSRARLLGKEYTKEQYKEAYEKYPDVVGLGERTGSKVRKGIGVGADVVGFTAATAIAGPLGALGYSTARGIQLLSKKPSKEEALLDIREAWGKRLKGEEIKPSPLLEEYKGYRSQAGIYLLTGAASGVQTTGRIAKQIDILRLQEAEAASTKTVGKFYDINEEKWLKTITRKETPYYRERTNIDVPIFQKEKGRFAIGVGQGKQEVEFLPFSRAIRGEGWQKISREFVVAGRGQTKSFLAKGVQAPSKYTATLGEGYFGVKGGPSRQFEFGGISEDVGKAYVGKGGRASTLKIPRVDSREVGPLVISRETPAPSFKIPIKDTSVIFKTTPTVEGEAGLKVTKEFTKSSKGFLDQLTQKQTPEFGGFAGAASRGVSKTVPSLAPPIKPSVPILAPSVYAGTGQYEVTRGGTVPGMPNGKMDILTPTTERIIKPSTVISPALNISLDVGRKTKTKTRQKTKQKNLLDVATDSLTRQQTRQRTRQQTRQQTRQKQLSLMAPPLVPPTAFTPTGFGGGGGLPFGGFDLPKRKAPKIKRQRKVRSLYQRTGYTPSLTGIQFSFTEKTKPGKILGGYGPGIRGVVRTKKKSRRSWLF